MKGSRRAVCVVFILFTIFFSSSCIGDRDIVKTYDHAILLYLGANNNLASFAQENVSLLKSGYLPNKGDRRLFLVFSHIKGSEPRMYRLYKDGNRVVEEAIITMPGRNSADYLTLKYALQTMKERYKSNEYSLIMWSHATGWLPRGYYSTHPLNQAPFEDPYASIVKSFGEDSGVEMDIRDMVSAIDYKLSFILFDCCLMGGVEVLYELKDRCDYVIASPTEILATGFPYGLFTEDLYQGEDGLRSACEKFYQFYNDSDSYNSATISLYKTAYLDDLAEKFALIIQRSDIEISSVNIAEIQPYYRFGKYWFYDLDHLVQKISSRTDANEFTSALDRVVIGRWSTPYFLGVPIVHYGGLSTYIPNPSDPFLDNYYKGYRWNSIVGLVK